MRFEDEVKTLFDAIVALPSSEWEAALSEPSRDPAVVAELRRLLASFNPPSGFLDRGAADEFGNLIREIGTNIGEFKILQQIGRGGMGVVYLAEDTNLGRKAAIKVLPGLAKSEQDLARFRQEARAAGRLAHENIVSVYRFGEHQGDPFIAMEYVEGETLGAVLTRRRAEAGQRLGGELRTGELQGAAAKAHIREMTSYLVMIAEALDYAHRQGVIHRDVKPSNILITLDGKAKLTDFGIAKTSADIDVTKTGDISGTFHYMSPEQARLIKHAVDHRTDIFSLGVVLYEALSLRRPFEGETSQQVIRALIDTEPTPLRRLSRAIPQDLAVVCHRALEKRPEDRMPTMAHLAVELRSCLLGEPIISRPPSLARRLKRVVRRRRAEVAVATILALAGVSAILAYISWRSYVSGLVPIVIRLQGAASTPIVTYRRWDDAQARLSEPKPLGRIPLETRLAPGPYRFTIRNSTGVLAEFDDYLILGASIERVVRVPPQGEPSSAMIEFSADQFVWTMRSPITGNDETITRQLPAFRIDAAEVSVAQFKQFLDATGRKPPDFWVIRPPQEIHADLPAVGVTREDALAYALWRGKRLPTLDEWMAAAQYPGPRLMPWGEGPPPPTAFPSFEAVRLSKSRDLNSLLDQYYTYAQPVMSAPELANVSGLHHMLSNVREFTGTVLTNQRMGGALVAVVVGADWTHDPTNVNLTSTALQPLLAPSPRLGFRCASSVDPKPPTQPAVSPSIRSPREGKP